MISMEALDKLENDTRQITMNNISSKTIDEAVVIAYSLIELLYLMLVVLN